jgi:putative NADPH-quinone reductase
LPRTDVLPPVIRKHMEEILQADGIVVVHPNWWSMPPAI